jgi:hypothetical protein
MIKKLLLYSLTGSALLSAVSGCKAKPEPVVKNPSALQRIAYKSAAAQLISDLQNNYPMTSKEIFDTQQNFQEACPYILSTTYATPPLIKPTDSCSMFKLYRKRFKFIKEHTKNFNYQKSTKNDWYLKCLKSKTATWSKPFVFGKENGTTTYAVNYTIPVFLGAEKKVMIFMVNYVIPVDTK